MQDMRMERFHFDLERYIMQKVTNVQETYNARILASTGQGHNYHCRKTYYIMYQLPTYRNAEIHTTILLYCVEDSRTVFS